MVKNRIGGAAFMLRCRKGVQAGQGGDNPGHESHPPA
jgi:hypothetical protein